MGMRPPDCKEYFGNFSTGLELNVPIKNAWCP